MPEIDLSKLPKVMTVNALNKVTGRDRRTIEKILRDIPKEESGGYDTKRVVPLIMADLENTEQSRDRKGNADIRWREARARRMEQDADREAGKLVLKDDVKRTAAQMVTGVTRKLFAAPVSIAARVQHKLGLTTEQTQTLEAEIRQHLNDICNQMAGKEWE